VNPETVAVLIAVVSSLTTITLGYFKLLSDLRATHELVNSRMTELLTLTRESATAKANLVRRPRKPRTLDLPTT
jgi:hypothetical protein